MKNRIKEIRQNNHITLEYLSKLTGISIAMLSRYENYNDIYKIPYNKSQKIAEGLGVSFNKLVGNDRINEKDIPPDIKNNKSFLEELDYKKYFSSFNELLLASDRAEIKEKEVKIITDKLFALNSNGLMLIDEYIDFIKSKQKYNDYKSYNEYVRYKNLIHEKIDELTKHFNNLAKEKK